MADSVSPAAPLSRGGLVLRIALYVVSFALWLLLVLASRSLAARIGGAFGCSLTLLILVGYVRRYRALRSAGLGK